MFLLVLFRKYIEDRRLTHIALIYYLRGLAACSHVVDTATLAALWPWATFMLHLKLEVYDKTHGTRQKHLKFKVGMEPSHKFRALACTRALVRS